MTLVSQPRLAPLPQVGCHWAKEQAIGNYSSFVKVIPSETWHSFAQGTNTCRRVVDVTGPGHKHTRFFVRDLKVVREKVSAMGSWLSSNPNISGDGSPHPEMLAGCLPRARITR